MTRKIIAILLVTLLASALPGAAQSAKPGMKEDDDKFVLYNEFVTVWFQGKKPMLRVSAAGTDGDATSFHYKFTEIVEYRDVDANGAPSQGEVLSSLNLEKASAWNVSSSEEEGAVILNLSMEAPVKVGRNDLTEDLNVTEGVAKISLLFTIRSAASTVNASGEDILVPATSIKYDLVVDQWPFVNAELSRLALTTKVVGELALDDGTRSAEVSVNGTTVGALSWTANATGTTVSGENLTVPVRTAITRGLDNETVISYTYDAPNLATLVHDPTIGVAPTQASLEPSAAEAPSRVPAPGALLVATAIGAAAVLVRSRRS